MFWISHIMKINFTYLASTFKWVLRNTGKLLMGVWEHLKWEVQFDSYIMCTFMLFYLIM